jgi:hypothetical protein
MNVFFVTFNKNFVAAWKNTGFLSANSSLGSSISYKIFQSEESEIYLTVSLPIPAVREAEDKVFSVPTKHDAMKKSVVEI